MSSFTPYNPNAATNDGDDFDPPADGTYGGCTLRDAGAFTSKAGNDGVMLEWETTEGTRWKVWSGFKSEKQSAVTWSDVGKLGVDPMGIDSLDDLDAALKNCIGGYYDLAVKTNGQFRNTYINGASAGSNPVVSGQSQMAHAAAPAAAAAPADDDIPF